MVDTPLPRTFAMLNLFCIILVISTAFIPLARAGVTLWSFVSPNHDLVPHGKVTINEPGPRPPEFPDFEENNTAIRLDGRNSRVMIEDLGESSPFDFTTNDAITMEAWVKVEAIKSGQNVYIIGKGRTGNPGFAADNQNWSLRLVGGSGGFAKISFLFASGSGNWHRWVSSAGFLIENGWHHVAISYEFGQADSLRAWIDGVTVDGDWDLNGATDRGPMVDDDAVWIGSALRGNPSNTFHGWIDEVAVHRKALTDAQIAERYRREGGPQVMVVEVPKMPELTEVPQNRVLVQFSEGLPAYERWPNQSELPEETARWAMDGFLLPRVPLRFDDWGIRSEWASPLLIRFAADVELPPGQRRVLLRTRGMARLWIDGELVAETKRAQTYARDGEELVTPLAKPPHPGVRVKSYRQQEVFGEINPESNRTARIVLELIVGGKGQRTETGEVVVALENDEQHGFNVLQSGIALSDAECEPVLAAVEAELTDFDIANRRRAAASRDKFWAYRRTVAKEWAEQNPAPEIPGVGHPVDAFLNAKIGKAIAASSNSEDESSFHKEVLPILREECFRCHGEKKKGGLKLNSREFALAGGDSEFPTIVPGKPNESELMERIRTDDVDLVMPPTGDGLSEKQIAVLESWIRDGALWPAPPVDPEKVNLAPRINDAAFIRRIHLDLIGLPPTEASVRTFLADKDPGKRGKLIDRLLADERRADHEISEWLDLLAENPVLINQSLNSTGPFRFFLHDALLDRKPLDRLITELILMRGDVGRGGSAGFALAAENDAPFAEKGHIVASAFLGIELQCARCHDSPYHSTTQQDLYSLAAMLARKPVTVPSTSMVPAGFFEEKVRESLIQVTLKPNTSIKPHWPFSNVTGISHDKDLERLMENPSDSRERLGALITSPKNRRFPRVIVNRLWKRLMGAGFVEPAHDWEGREASHPELLDWLVHELLSNGFDLTHVLRLIVTSDAYQRKAIGLNLAAGHQDRFFNAPDPRRLTAEQIVDSLHASAGVAIDSEELTFVYDGRRPLNKRQSVGVPKRAWNFVNLNNERDRPSLALPRAQAVADVLQAFGWTGSRQKPIPHRDQDPNVLQPGILANGTLTQNLSRAAAGSQIAQQAVNAESAHQLLDSIFLRFLGRMPTKGELTEFLPALETGFETRLVQGEIHWPQPDDPLPQVTWFNHGVSESNTIQLENEKRVRRGPPVDPRLEPSWRVVYEDLVWSLINHREFVWIP